MPNANAITRIAFPTLLGFEMACSFAIDSALFIRDMNQDFSVIIQARTFYCLTFTA